MMLLFVGILTFARIVYWFVIETKHPEGFPDGPRLSLPFLGNAMALAQKDAFIQMRQKYGNIYGFWLGQIRTVVVCGFDLIQEIGTNEHCQDRIYVPSCPTTRGPNMPDGTYPGLMSAEGKHWVESRRFTLQTFRNLGFGKHSMEIILHEEVSELLRDLEMKKDRPIELSKDLVISVLNSLWRILTNERLQASDPKLQELNIKVDLMLREAINPISRMFFEYGFLRWLNKYLKISHIADAIESIISFVRQPIKDHQQFFQKGNGTDFIDAFLNKATDKEEQEKEASSFSGHQGENNLANILVDLFIAGKDTTTTTLNWAFLYMIQHPDIQHKVQNELDAITHSSRLPELKDQDQTPFTNAVIHEAQRLSNVIPVSVPHSTNKQDVIIGKKFLLPRYTHIMLDMGSVMLNPEQFPNPLKFDPSRFINSSGNFEPHPHVIPFGVGKRRCIGETLAKQSLYLYFAGILSKFEVLPERPGAMPSLDATVGVVRAPLPYKLRLKARNL